MKLLIPLDTFKALCERREAELKRGAKLHRDWQDYQAKNPGGGTWGPDSRRDRIMLTDPDAPRKPPPPYGGGGSEADKLDRHAGLIAIVRTCAPREGAEHVEIDLRDAYFLFVGVGVGF